MNPLVKPSAETIPTLLNFPPPTHLKHTPIFMLPYEHFDGCYAGNTDTKYISIGLAQWRNEDDPNAISAKTWRHPDNKWSRLSEELPLHRVIDLCIFMTTTIFGRGETTAKFPEKTFEHQNEPLELNMLGSFPKEFDCELEKIKGRLNELCRVMENVGINSHGVKEQQDMEVDGEWLPLALKKGILQGNEIDYQWVSHRRVPTCELNGQSAVIIPNNENKKIVNRIVKGKVDDRLVLVSKIP